MVLRDISPPQRRTVAWKRQYLRWSPNHHMVFQPRRDQSIVNTEEDWEREDTSEVLLELTLCPQEILSSDGISRHASFQWN